MKITDQQRRWYHREFEDFEFRGDLLDMEVSLTSPIPGPDDEDMPWPELVVQINRICKPSEVVIEGDEADRHYTSEEVKLLVGLVEERLADEAVEWHERQQER